LSPQQIERLEALMPPVSSGAQRAMYRFPAAGPWTGAAEIIARDADLNVSAPTERSIPAQGYPKVSLALADHLAATWRVAQAPSWLNYSKLDPASRSHPYYLKDPSSSAAGHRKGKHSYPNLRYAGHSEIFHLPTLDRDGKTEELGEREWREKEWKKQALPSFNSMAIETRIGWLPGLVR
jgi:3-O-alpha-D-mannopyranosyl-alpha-D-mannopyranose xylosylphosphotransferase